MLTRLTAVLVGTFLLTTVNALSDASPPLADSDIRSIFESLNENGFYQIPLGHLAVVRQGFASGKGNISEVQYKWLLAAKKTGLVSVEEVPQRSSNFSWDKMLDTTVAGVIARIVVTLTPHGQTVQTCRCPEILQIHTGTVAIKRIVRREPMKRGLEDYELVMLTYRATYTPDWENIQRLVAGKTPDDNMKAILLYRFDPFKNSWSIDAEDIAPESGEFRTHFVAQRLQQHP